MRLFFLCLVTLIVTITGCSTIEDRARGNRRSGRSGSVLVDKTAQRVLTPPPEPAINPAPVPPPEMKQLFADIAALPQAEQIKYERIIGELRKIDAATDPALYDSMVGFVRTALLSEPQTTECYENKCEIDTATTPTKAPEATTAAAPTALPDVPHETAESPILTVSYLAPASTTEEMGHDDWKASVAQAAETLRHRVASTDDEVRLRLLELALGRQQEAARAIDGVDASTRAFWTNEMLGLSVLLDEQILPDSASRHAAAIHHLALAQGGLRQHCPLKIQQMMFVEKWYGFGSYTPLSGEFNAGETASLYLELENMTVRESPLGFNTHSSSSYSLIDGAGTVVARAENITAEETSQSRRRDSCLMIPIAIPKTISPGPYQIKLTVTDLNHDKLQYAVEQISLRIRSHSRNSDE